MSTGMKMGCITSAQYTTILQNCSRKMSLITLYRWKQCLSACHPMYLISTAMSKHVCNALSSAKVATLKTCTSNKCFFPLLKVHVFNVSSLLLSWVFYDALCKCFMLPIFVIHVSFKSHLWLFNILMNLFTIKRNWHSKPFFNRKGCWHSKMLKFFHCNHDSSIAWNNHNLACIFSYNNI